jgi:hypothetical protein
MPLEGSNRPRRTPTCQIILLEYAITCCVTWQRSLCADSLAASSARLPAGWLQVFSVPVTLCRQHLNLALIAMSFSMSRDGELPSRLEPVEIVKTPRRASTRVPSDLLPRCSLAQKSRVRAPAQESPSKHTPNYESQGPSLRTAPPEHILDLLFAPAAHQLARGLYLEAAARSGERL